MKITLQENPHIPYHIYNTFIALNNNKYDIQKQFVFSVYNLKNTKLSQQHYTNRFKKIKGIITIIFLKIKKKQQNTQIQYYYNEYFFEDLNDYYYEMRKKYNKQSINRHPQVYFRSLCDYTYSCNSLLINIMKNVFSTVSIYIFLDNSIFF